MVLYCKHMKRFNLHKAWQRLARADMASLGRELAGPQARADLLLSAGYGSDPKAMAGRLALELSRRLPLADLEVSGRRFGRHFDGPERLARARAEAAETPPAAPPPGASPARGRERAAGDPAPPWATGMTLCRLARAWRVTGDDDLFRACGEHLESFCRGNPPPAGPAWSSLQTAAVRAWNWLFAWRLLGEDLPRLGPDVLAQALVHLEVGAGLLAGRLREGPAGLDRIGPAASLFILGHSLPFLPEADGWREEGRLALGLALAAWSRPGPPLSGGSLTAACQWAGLAAWLAVAAAIEVPGLAGGLPRLAEHCRRLAPPWGGNASWGAVSLSEIWRFDPEDPDPATAAANLAAVAQNAPELRAARVLDEGLYWLLGPAAAERLRLLAGGPAPVPGDAPAAGHSVLVGAGAGRKAAAILRTSPRRRADGAAWQAQALDLALCLAGRPVLLPPGPSGGGPLARHLAGRAAHNAPVVDGIEPVGGRVELEALERGAGQQFISATYDGYRGLPDPVILRRRVHLDLERGLINLVDQVMAEGEHHLTVHLRLPPEARVEPAGQGVWRLAGGFGRLWLKPDPRASLEVIHGASDPPLGWLAVAPGRVLPCPVVRLQATTAGHARLGVTLVWGEG